MFKKDQKEHVDSLHSEANKEGDELAFDILDFFLHDRLWELFQSSK